MPAIRLWPIVLSTMYIFSQISSWFVLLEMAFRFISRFFLLLFSLCVCLMLWIDALPRPKWFLTLNCWWRINFSERYSSLLESICWTGEIKVSTISHIQLNSIFTCCSHKNIKQSSSTWNRNENCNDFRLVFMNFIDAVSSPLVENFIHIDTLNILNTHWNPYDVRRNAMCKAWKVFIRFRANS